MNEFMNSPTLTFNSSSESGFNIDCAIGIEIYNKANIFIYSDIIK